MPLEQLLAQYGYAPPTSVLSTSASATSEDTTAREAHHSSKDHTSSKQAESGPSVRSRRRNRVVPLQRQKAPTPDDKEHTPSPLNRESASQEESGRIPNDNASRTDTKKGMAVSNATPIDTPPVEKKAATTHITEQAKKGVEQELKTTESKQGTKPSTELSSIEHKGVGLLRRWEGQEDTDGEEVDVVEVGEVDLGLERDDGETILSLDPLQRGEFDVVRMGDIEAGLKIEGALGEYEEEAGLSSRGGALGEYEGVGLGGGERDYEEAGLSGGEGAFEEEEEGVAGQDNAVYDDVLLSSGNTRLLSDPAGN